jgi:hypothetical protein
LRAQHYSLFSHDLKRSAHLIGDMGRAYTEEEEEKKKTQSTKCAPSKVQAESETLERFVNVA